MSAATGGRQSAGSNDSWKDPGFGDLGEATPTWPERKFGPRFLMRQSNANAGKIEALERAKAIN
jgi:hypothetical protein